MIRRTAVDAFAKINLVLDLLGPRPDGYTEIATVFQSIGLGDRLELELDTAQPPGVVLRTAGAEPCPPEENLAFRAARAFEARFGLPGRLAIVLHKRVPAGAGLGGGSADAAAVLRALAAWPGSTAGADAAALHACARGLGADVPFFLAGGLAVGRGRGDELETLPDLDGWPLVLARAGRPLATAEVYGLARHGLTARRHPPNIRRFMQHLEDAPHSIPPVHNDLLPAAASLEPLVPAVIAALGSLGARAGMTGSGSTVFGLFADESAADAAVALLPARAPVTFVYGTRTIPRAQGAAPVAWND